MERRKRKKINGNKRKFRVTKRKKERNF